jgi:hypothetical protein
MSPSHSFSTHQGKLHVATPTRKGGWEMYSVENGRKSFDEQLARLCHSSKKTYLMWLFLNQENN